MVYNNNEMSVPRRGRSRMGFYSFRIWVLEVLVERSLLVEGVQGTAQTRA